MTPAEPKFGGFLEGAMVDDAERSRAASVTDALGELGGKRLDKPTAHSLGKLFQKRLVDRPAYIEDGHKVATLRKSIGHNENKYRVDLSALRQAADLEAFKDSSGVNTGMNIPHIPHIPQGGRPIGTNVGNVGKDGNVSTDAPLQHNPIRDGNSREKRWGARL